MRPLKTKGLRAARLALERFFSRITGSARPKSSPKKKPTQTRTDVASTANASDVVFKINKRRGSVKVSLPDYMSTTPLGGVEVEKGLKSIFAKFSSGGENNVISIGQNINAKKFAVAIKGNNNRIVIGSNVILSGLLVIAGSNITVFIGANTTFNHVKMYCKGGSHGVYIGRDCMFSADIEIRTSDAHSVIDLDNMTQTNLPDGIFIGDHVWVAKQVFIQKGSVIESDNIVGFGAMVSGDFPDSNSVIVGRPAKAKLDRRVSWSRKGKLKVVDDSIFEWKKGPLL